MTTSSLTADEARERLEAMRADYSQRLARFERHRRRSEGALSADADERAIEVENDETVDALAEGAVAIIRQIDHALQRLRIGLWGFCEGCGRPIDAHRLARLPEATRCSRCALKD